MKPKSKIGGYIFRGSVLALFFWEVKHAMLRDGIV
jgi:hypothetical protein